MRRMNIVTWIWCVASLAVVSLAASAGDDPAKAVDALEDSLFELEGARTPDPDAYAVLLAEIRDLRTKHARRRELVSRILTLELTLHRIYGKQNEYLSCFAAVSRRIERPGALGLELLSVPAAVESALRFPGLDIESSRAERVGIAFHALESLVTRFPRTETAADAIWTSYLLLPDGDERADQLLRRLAKPPYSEFDAGKRARVFLWARKHLRDGVTIPAVTWTSSDGEKLSTRDLGSRPAVLCFWISGCAPCGPTIALLREAAKRFADRVSFIGLNYDPDQDSFRRGVAKYQPPGRQVHMPSQPAAQRFPASAFPQIVILKASGEVHRTLVDRRELLTVLSALGE